MNKKWSEKTTFEKTVDIIAGIALGVWLIFEILEKKQVEYASLGACISLCVICVCEAISFWKVKRALSYVAIGGIVLMLTAVVLQIVLAL